jgi:hypothetical protein
MKRLLLALASAAALWSAACGGGGTTVLPPPTGKYSAASLNGTYAFVTDGEVFASGATATPLARTGSFMANGSGGITGGVEDVNAGGSVNPPVAITGGSYTINADGRGTLTLTLGQSSIDFFIVLTSTNDGLMIDETANFSQSSTGSGNFIKQNSSSFLVSGIAGPYVFDFAGLDGNQTFPCPCPESFIGEFMAASGVTTTGFADDNDNGTFSSGSITGTFAQDPLSPTFPMANFGRGVANIAGQNFVFYIVDGTRVRFLSTTGGMLSGDAVAQSNNVPTNVSSFNSGFAFVVAGSSGMGGLTRVGRFTANGANVSSVLVDTNNNGVFTQTTGATNASITLDAANPGRGTVTFLGNNLSTPFTFVFYLSSASSGVIQETTQSTQGVAAAVADGTIAAQTGNPFSSTNIAGTYAMNWSGLSIQQGGSFPTQDEEDLLAQATVSSLALSGAGDIFQFTNPVPQIDNIVSGSIAFNGGDGTGVDGKRSTMLVNLTKNGATAPVNFVVYFVNPQLAFFANTSTSSTRIVAGILKAQQ